jgi:hypothetical protein
MLRMEVFLAGSIGVLIVAWVTGLNALIGTAVSIAIVGGLGGFVVLGAEDRDCVIGWLTRQRVTSSAA